MNYKPKTVFITGATGDFGKAFAKKFSDIGCALILHGRSEEKLEALRNDFSVPFHTALFDITDRTAMERSIHDLPSAFKNVDLLINNAGGALGLDKAQDSDLDDWEQMVQMNVLGLIRMTRLMLPTMVSRKQGHIINIGSTAGSFSYPGGHVYCASKAFVKHFSQTIRSDLQGTNIRVTNIEPGAVQTQFSLTRFKGDKEKADAVYANTKPLLAEDIAEAVYWTSIQPPHMNVTRMEIMPTAQSPGPWQVERFN